MQDNVKVTEIDKDTTSGKGGKYEEDKISADARGPRTHRGRDPRAGSTRNERDV